MDCSPKCRKAKHDDLNFSAVINIGQEDAAKVQATLPRLCPNFARVADQCGRNALHLAASSGKCDILEWLVREQAADLNSKDEESGWTSLHRSVFYGYLDCAVKLIQLGSDLSCIDKEGLTPLDLIQLDSPFQIMSGVEARVVSSYETCLQDELKLSIGDVVKDIQMTGNKYWIGNLNGKRGYFPRHRVDLLMKDYPLELFTWGSNTNFALGHRDESTRHAPEILECVLGDAKLYIKEVVMRKFHSVFLSADGRVLTCGHGRGGRLGHGNEETFLEPQEVTALRHVKSISISAGQDHTVVVTEDGSVYTFGLNDSHQLGHSPAPKECLLPKLVQVKSWRGKVIIGAAAGRYHSVFFTQSEVYSCGLNAGQLGHLKGEKYQTLPRQVSGVADKNVVISKVVCSDGATVCATVKGDIFLLNLYTCRRIITRFTDLTSLAVVGGKLDMVSPQNIGNKFADELAVTLLNSRGMVFQWKPEFSSHRQCYWYYNRPITVRDFAVGKQFLIVSDRGEAFTCLPNKTKVSPVKADSKKRNRSSSTSSTMTESTPAHSPTTPSPLKDKDKDDVVAQSSLNCSVLSLLAEETSKKDVVEYYLERIPFVHRGLRVFTDSKSRGFAVLQISAKEGLKRLPRVSPEKVWQNLTQLLEETTREDDIHDVEFLVKGHIIPAHGFVLASRSPKCQQLICENKENWPQMPGKRIRTIPLHENLDCGVVMAWLKRLYSGEEISDKELFPKDFAVKGKNGFHSIKKGNNKNKVTVETEKIAGENKVAPEFDEVEDVMPDRVLADLVYLAERDLDDLTAPTVEDGEDFSVNNGHDMATTDIMNLLKMKERSTSETKTLERKDKEDDRSIGREQMALSRTNCPELYDVVIVSEDGSELPCHKCVLVAQLDYFRSMWASGWLEASEPSKVIKLPFPAIILELVLDFLYSGQAGKIQEITDLELLGHILIVADQLLICRLREICEAVIANLITLKNVNEILEFSMLYNASQLRDVCTEFITNNLGSMMEARILDSLSDEALAEASKAYRRLVPGMAWRVITPSDIHDSVLNESPDPYPGKRRKNAGRKKSSKSESEQDVAIPETAQDNQAEEVERSYMKENEEVFLQQEDAGRDSPTADEEGKSDAIITVQHTTQDDQGTGSQTAEGSGLWYRKNSPEDIKPKKRTRDKKQPVGKPVEVTDTSQKEDNATKKIPSLEKPAWSNKTSIPSPPATSLKDIIEQEQSQAVYEGNSAGEISPCQGTLSKLPSDQRVTSPPGGARWNSRGRISQKQRKRSKSNTPDQSEEDKRNGTVGTEKEEKMTPAWGGVSKGPAPVKSLRDLMHEEEQQSEKKPEMMGLPPASTPRPAAQAKAGSSRRKLNWRPQPDFYASPSDVDAKEIIDIDFERLSGLPSSPPKSAWHAAPIACSPPSSSIAFSTILESQEQENSNLNKVYKKPFHLTQLEERAMEELMQFYGGKDNACEFVTVQRIPSTTARPVWKKERSPSVTSNERVFHKGSI